MSRTFPMSQIVPEITVSSKIMKYFFCHAYLLKVQSVHCYLGYLQLMLASLDTIEALFVIKTGAINLRQIQNETNSVLQISRDGKFYIADDFERAERIGL